MANKSVQIKLSCKNNKTLIVLNSNGTTVESLSELKINSKKELNMSLKEFIGDYTEIHESILDGGWSDYAKVATDYLSHQKNELEQYRPIYFTNIGLSFYKKEHNDIMYLPMFKNGTIFMEDDAWKGYLFPLSIDEAIQYIGYLQGSNCINDIGVDIDSSNIQELVYSKAIKIKKG